MDAQRPRDAPTGGHRDAGHPQEARRTMMTLMTLMTHDGADDADE
jgi:hypothetical protein